CFVFFFFFQAEDGIRDGHVTGVQTCALPISYTDMKMETRVMGSSPRPSSPISSFGAGTLAIIVTMPSAGAMTSPSPFGVVRIGRSEERRVGEEWRARWWTDH